MRARTILVVVAALAASFPGSGLAMEDTPWPLGSFVTVPGDPQCVPGFSCRSFAVTDCAGVSRDAEGVLAHAAPAGAPRGLIVFFSGSRGKGWWNGGNGIAGAFLDRLRDTHRFVIVQVKWVNAWLVASDGEDAGVAHLACRPATVVDWIYQHRFLPLGVSVVAGRCGFCVTGNSGGASQSIYGLSHYGLDGIIAAVVPTSGPPHAGLTKACLPGFPEYEFDDESKALVDSAHGFIGRTGPCVAEDPEWVPRWDEESPETAGYDHTHPRTRVEFVIGGLDDSAAPVHAADYFDVLLAEPTNHVTWTVVPSMGHTIQVSEEGLDALEAALVG